MNSTSRSPYRGRSLLKVLQEALNRDRVQQKTFQPVEAAASTFPYPSSEPSGLAEFTDVVGDFLHHLSWHGRSTKVRLSRHDGKATAVSLLERHYEGVLSAGHAGAFLDASRPEGPGLRAVLQEMAGIVAKEELRHRSGGILVRLVNPLDWHTQKELVEEMLFLLGPDLPPLLAERPVDSLVPAYLELLDLLLQTEGFLDALRFQAETLGSPSPHKR